MDSVKHTVGVIATFRCLMNNRVDLRTVQLLCSRLCHDLIGPVGAINTAIELMGDEDAHSLDVEALKVMAKSASEASRKLVFFRAVFGVGGSQETVVQLSDLMDLTDEFLVSRKVAAQWDTDIPRTLPGDVGRVLMLLTFLAAEALPRGGKVEIRVQTFNNGLGVACIAEGDGAILPPEIEGVLKGGTTSDKLSVRGIPAYVLLLLTDENGATVEFSLPQSGQVALAVLFSDGFLTKQV